MIARFFLSLLFVFSVSSWAQNYGYIRVHVIHDPPPPANHTWLIKLYANHRGLGKEFSHVSSGFTWTPLDKGNLSSLGANTPISADYGSLASNGCSFEFEIYFSFDGKSGEIPLGRYRAPTESINTSIPLGLKCGSDSEEICSSNPDIQRALDKLQMKARIDEYNRWKQEYDNKVKDQEAEAALKQAELDRMLEEKALEDFMMDVTEADRLLNKELEDMDKYLDEQAQAEMEMLVQAAIDEATKTEDMAAAAEDVVALDSAERLRLRVQENREELMKTPLGQFIYAWVEVERMMDEMIEMQKSFLGTAADGGYSLEEQLEAVKHLQNMQWARRQWIKPDVAVAAVKEGIRLAGGDGFDICEVVTGKELCVGKDLSMSERVVTGLGVVVGNGPFWRRIKNKFEDVFLSQVDDAINTVKRYKIDENDIGMFKEIVRKDIIKPDGKVGEEVLKRIRETEFQGKNIIIDFEDGTRLVIRRDVGIESHGLQDHYNLDIHVPTGRPGRYVEDDFSMHVFLTEDGTFENVVFGPLKKN